MAMAVPGLMSHTIQKDTERTGFGKSSPNTGEPFYQILSKHSDGLNSVTCPALSLGTDCHWVNRYSNIQGATWLGLRGQNLLPKLTAGLIALYWKTKTNTVSLSQKGVGRGADEDNYNVLHISPVTVSDLEIPSIKGNTEMHFEHFVI